MTKCIYCGKTMFMRDGDHYKICNEAQIFKLKVKTFIDNDY